MRPSVPVPAALAVAAAVLLAGCGGSDGSDAAAEPSASTPPPQQTTSGSPGTPAENEDTSGDDDVTEIEIEIEDGEVEPAGRRVDVQVGQTIRLVVDSDTADEIHVHSTPEHTFSFKAGAEEKVFEFALRQPGVVEAELHELGDVVLTFAARP